MTTTFKSLDQAIRERRSTPSFDGVPMPQEDIRHILEAGAAAPSGYNIQPWRFIEVQSSEQKRKLRANAWLAEQAGFAGKRLYAADSGDHGV